MRQKLDISIERIQPEPAGVFELQGIPAGASVPERVKNLYNSAEELFHELANPIGLMASISVENFVRIYAGTGMNEPDTPLKHIYPHSCYLALFAFTLGMKISREIRDLNQKKNLALAFMLDSLASYSADKAAEAGQEMLHKQVFSEGKNGTGSRVLLYSPGYCGWHVSGQGKLFEYLKPEEIGITLNKSFLMTPLKSISGVLVAGETDIHRFTANYPFCAQCRTQNCRKRMNVKNC